jgi:hypothetical protein
MNDTHDDTHDDTHKATGTCATCTHEHGGPDGACSCGCKDAKSEAN